MSDVKMRTERMKRRCMLSIRSPGTRHFSPASVKSEARACHCRTRTHTNSRSQNLFYDLDVSVSSKPRGGKISGEPDFVCLPALPEIPTHSLPARGHLERKERVTNGL